MGMGLPIILCAPEGEATRIIEMTNSGVSIAPENPEMLAEAFVKLDTDSQLKLKYSTNSVQSSPLYTREKQAKEMLEVFNEVVGVNKISYCKHQEENIL
jgi:hypothetical protein